jgi:hypothetical protein
VAARSVQLPADLWVLAGVEHYARGLARLTDQVCEPGWAPTPELAAARVRTNLHALRQVLQRSHAGEIRSAEAVVGVAGSVNVGGQRTR